MDDDALYDDDIDFDNLPQATLDNLEQQARLSTQQQGNAREKNGTIKSGHQQRSSSDYGFRDEDVIDLDARPGPAFNARFSSRRVDDPVTQREAWRQQRYGAPSRIDHQSIARNGQEPYHTNMMHTDRAVETNTAGQDDIADAQTLKVRIAQLEQEKANLQKNVENANNVALARAGENSIVRSNLENAKKEYERRITDLQKQHTGDAARAKAELEAARREREKIETNNKFLEHDLAQEAERAKAFKKSLRDSGRLDRRNSPQESPLSTPKKSKALAIRDGFDDDPMPVLSPSNLKKPATPRAGAKRKRVLQENKTAQSPSLSFTGPTINLQDEGLGPLPEDSPQTPAPVPLPKHDLAAEQSELLQSVLNHRSGPDRERILESLTKLSFPSTPERSVSSYVFDQLAPTSAELNLHSYRLRICDVLLRLWSRCLEEKFYIPLYKLTELLRYILMISPASLSTVLISQLVVLCQKTADLIALPTAKAAKMPSGASKSLVSLTAHINPLECLEIMHLTALNCESSSDLVTFWTSVEFDFILLMLHKAQPINQIIQMLQLLFTSVLEESFGAIATNPSESQTKDESAPRDTSTISTTNQQKQHKNETDIIDRLTVLLFETPQPQHLLNIKSNQDSSSYLGYELDVEMDLDDPSQLPPPPTPNSPSHTMQLRYTVLDLLYTLAETLHGAQLLSNHRLAIPRLVRFLHETILQLYAFFPSDTHELTAQCINTCVFLLARLDSADAGADIRGKLAAIPGGLQRWLVSLSRTAFAENVGVDGQGLNPEACEEAHRILDEMLSPEEGEGVLGVFLSGR